MYGSYNWMSTDHNNETLAIVLNYELVVMFTKEFMRLYNGIHF